jgi:LCP family protein required for cell wall assembly
LRYPKVKPGCILVFLSFIGVCLVFLVYYLVPPRTNILILGIDFADIDNAVARSDTIMLATFLPVKNYIGVLSIPRDLWIDIPGVGQNRINTAHYYAEIQQEGSGPSALQRTITQNFGLDVPYYFRIRFETFRGLVNAMGGVDIELFEPMAGYPPGKHHLTPRKALAFVRHRQGSDDFFRMENGQFMLKSIIKNLLNPLKWPRFPWMIKTIIDGIDTNIPFWMWPRLAINLLIVGPDGIDSRIITRQMVTPIVTDQGANVLLPNWNLIIPIVQEMFK